MMYLVKIITSSVDDLARRLVKFYRLGLRDVQTSLTVAPYGDDSVPVKDMIAVYSETSTKGNTVIIGYINKNQLAAVGERRLFSTNENGDEKAYVWLKNSGNLELNGKADNVVRYSKLDNGLQAEVTKINAQLAAISTAIGLLGGSYVVNPVDVDISGAKVDDVLCD